VVVFSQLCDSGWLFPKSLILRAAFSEQTFTPELGCDAPRLRSEAGSSLRTAQTDSGPSRFDFAPRIASNA